MIKTEAWILWWPCSTPQQLQALSTSHGVDQWLQKRGSRRRDRLQKVEGGRFWSAQGFSSWHMTQLWLFSCLLQLMCHLFQHWGALCSQWTPYWPSAGLDEDKNDRNPWLPQLCRFQSRLCPFAWLLAACGHSAWIVEDLGLSAVGECRPLSHSLSCRQTRRLALSRSQGPLQMVYWRGMVGGADLTREPHLFHHH